MKNMKNLLFLLSVLLTACIVYNVFYSNTSEKFENKIQEFDSLNDENLLNLINEKYFKNINTPVGKKALVQNNNEINKVSTNVEPGKNYKITMWETKTSDWDGKDNLINIKLYNDNNVIDAISTNGIIKNTLKIGNLEWNNVEYNFKIPKHYKNIMDIFLGFKPNNKSGERYIANLNLRNFTSDIVDFPNIDSLILYLDAGLSRSYSNESAYKNYWNNIVDNHNFKFEKEPEWNNKGYFKMINKKIKGPSPKNLNMNNEEFSIIIISSSLGEVDTINPVALKIHGNQNVAFALSIPNSKDNLTLDIGDKKYIVDQHILTDNKNIITVTYKSNLVRVYLDESLIQEFKNVPNIYFNNKDIEINPYYKWNSNLYSILFYNKELNKKEIRFLSSYFKKAIIDNERNDLVPKNIQFNLESNNQDNYFIEKFNNKTVPGSENFSSGNLSNDDCPEVKIDDKNNKYIIKDVGNKYPSVSGNLEFKDKETCKNRYQLYFSECRLPDDFEEKKIVLDDCLFKDPPSHSESSTHPCINCPELNNYSYKENENLDIPSELSQKCKNSINSYCYKQKTLFDKTRNKNLVDDICSCYINDNKNINKNTVSNKLCNEFMMYMHNHLPPTE